MGWRLVPEVLKPMYVLLWMYAKIRGMCWNWDTQKNWTNKLIEVKCVIIIEIRVPNF